MSAEAFDRIARDASRRSEELDRIARRLHKLQAETTETIGGTATGADKSLLGQLGSAANDARRSARSFASAAAAAKRAGEQARARDQSSRTSQGGR